MTRHQTISAAALLCSLSALSHCLATPFRDGLLIDETFDNFLKLTVANGSKCGSTIWHDSMSLSVKTEPFTRKPLKVTIFTTVQNTGVPGKKHSFLVERESMIANGTNATEAIVDAANATNTTEANATEAIVDAANATNATEENATEENATEAIVDAANATNATQASATDWIVNKEIDNGKPQQLDKS